MPRLFSTQSGVYAHTIHNTASTCRTRTHARSPKHRASDTALHTAGSACRGSIAARRQAHTRRCRGRQAGTGRRTERHEAQEVADNAVHLCRLCPVRRAHLVRARSHGAWAISATNLILKKKKSPIFGHAVGPYCTRYQGTFQGPGTRIRDRCIQKWRAA